VKTSILFRAQCAALLSVQLVACSSAPPPTETTSEPSTVLPGGEPPRNVEWTHPPCDTSTNCKGWKQCVGSSPASAVCEVCGAAEQPPCGGAGYSQETGCEPWSQSLPGGIGDCLPCGFVNQPGCQGPGNESPDTGCASGLSLNGTECTQYCSAPDVPVAFPVGNGATGDYYICAACGEDGQAPCAGVIPCTGAQCNSVGCADPNAVVASGVCEPFQQVTWALTPAEVSGVAVTRPVTLTVTNAGVWVFTYSLNSQAWITQDHFVGATINATNSAGQQFVQGNGGAISSEFANDGSNNVSWTQAGYDSTIGPNWAAISTATMTANLEVSPNGWQSVQLAVEALGILPPNIAGTVFANEPPQGHGVCVTGSGPTRVYVEPGEGPCPS
jgi:hypothetical protein